MDPQLSFSEMPKNLSTGCMGGLVSHVGLSSHPTSRHSNSMSCFLPASQWLESKEKERKFYEYVRATVNLHFLYKRLKCSDVKEGKSIKCSACTVPEARLCHYVLYH